MRHCKMDNEPENHCQVTLFIANAQKVCKNCLHHIRDPAQAADKRGKWDFTVKPVQKTPAPTPPHGPGLRAPGHGARLFPAPLAAPGDPGTCL